MPAQPLDIYRAPVEAAWIDYNDHMNVAYYMLMFDRATDALFDRLGVGGRYRQRTNHSLFVLEAHVTYEREVKAGDMLRFATQLIDADAKRLHVFHAMHHEAAGYRAASCELLILHVDLAGPAACNFAPGEKAAIGALLAEHRELPRPAQLGRTIALRRTAPPAITIPSPSGRGLG
jgi:acyl-CoA thioester hydrolase